MKLPLSWLREWIDVPWSAPELAERLTMLGFEVEGVGAAAAPFSGVVVAEIVAAERHPRAEKLQVCRVSTGQAEPLQIVCGAPNARVGLRTALAQVGAQLPNGLSIGRAQLRGVDSAGMLCSAKELGLYETQPGILELDAQTILGADLRGALDLDEAILEVNVMPNRGDGMSVLGIAREVAALSGAALRGPVMRAAVAVGAPGTTVTLEPGCGAGRFHCRVLRGIDNTRPTPQWMQRRLQRAGLRPISPIVDVTNYVMLELGQPLHAYDAGRLRGGIGARRARAGETVRLLFSNAPTPLTGDELMIVDAGGPIGLAGVMGGSGTAVTATTRDVLLESAWFVPDVVAGRARAMGLTSEASQRFERGTDPAGIERALERATALMIGIAGGVAGPSVAAEDPTVMPPPRTVLLRARQLERLLGTTLPAERVREVLCALGMDVQEVGGGWQVRAPSWRFDIAIEADLIEEVARVVGLESIPEAPAPMATRLRALPETALDEPALRQLMVARGYQEAINFGFTDPALQTQLFGAQGVAELVNPIAAQLGVMRWSLWPGLVTALRANLARQADRVRLFEIATRFRRDGAGVLHEQHVIAALACGARWPEQWGGGSESVDFHDVKRDVEVVLQVLGAGVSVHFEPDAGMQCLHPGRSAQLVHQGRVVGHCGEINPALARALDLTYRPVLFEVQLDAIAQPGLAQFRAFSAYPHIRRDLSFTVADEVSFGRIRDRVSVAASSALAELRVFDIYQGKGVEFGRKSVALGLILQDLKRTLTDEDADRIMAAVVADLAQHLDARIRE
ncbi:MAG: phenylalanine--tRNA ligase subunit beta [Gammaproteobacteria bacterium]|nr:phenylalanine--tRNA ligase subunit beta [Gammaproteobacteria bacterium]